MFYKDSDLKDNEICLKITKTVNAQPKKHYVPAYYFDICLLDGTKVGSCDLRIGHNDNTYIGGNIGYSILEQYRGHRYAAKAVKILFKLAKKHDMKYLIITCSPTNLASKKTCEICGGFYIETAKIPENNDMYLFGQRENLIYKFDL